MNMPLKKKPVSGMKDILPIEMQIREYVLEVIRSTYRSFGYTAIDTPAVEHIENLSSKQGGDNEQLIFKILKRGEKLSLQNAESENDLCDSGLRYDLTVPLVRYFAAHENELPTPFKALQIGNVWRADRPQRGRFRQFTQCDIDIIGDASSAAEVELILATAQALTKIGFKGFQIRVNDRRILSFMASYCGFGEEEQTEVFASLDKMEKIGNDGVLAELEEKGFDSVKIKKVLDIIAVLQKLGRESDASSLMKQLALLLKGYLNPHVAADLGTVINNILALKTSEWEIVFDPTLVRGMGYYTGTVFEVNVPELGGSLGGGGRYDKMIGAFTGKNVPAVGFSLGFERIILLLMERGFVVPEQSERRAYLIEKGVENSKVIEIMQKAQLEREQGEIVLVIWMNKNKKFQIEQLQKEGYTQIVDVYLEDSKPT